MPNQFSFEVEFDRSDIEKIIKDSSVSRIVVSGYYEKTENGWKADAAAQGVDSENRPVQASVPAPCIKPCPTP